MTISTLSAARTLCEMRDWSVSNLEMQKILYVAHMFMIGRTNGEPLVDESFQAWDYGPVLPTLYHRAKAFGARPVRNVFHVASAAPGSVENQIIREASEGLKNLTPGQLVSFTHVENGAWAKHYRAGVIGIRIPNSDILQEYRERLG